MKTWHKIAIGTAAALSLGAIGYAIYEAHKSAVLAELPSSPSEVHDIGTQGTDAKCFSIGLEGTEGESEPSDSWTRDTDVCEIMDEVLVDTMDHVITYAKIAAQIAQERSSEKHEVATQLRKQCFDLSFFVFVLPARPQNST